MRKVQNGGALFYHATLLSADKISLHGTVLTTVWSGAQSSFQFISGHPTFDFYETVQCCNTGS